VKERQENITNTMNSLVLGDEIGRHFKYPQRNDLADDDITRICGTKY
jgi:hypothetical protein